MDKSTIRNFSIEARKILMKSAETEAGFYGVTRKGCKSPIQKGNDFEVYETLAGTENRIYGADIKKRANLVEAVDTLGFDQVIEETAYTWFNRIIAIRFMEVNGYLPTRVRVLSSETGSNTPDIVTQSLDVDLNMTPEELEKVQKAKDENRYDDAFRMLFVKQCNELNAILPGLFEKTDDYMELLLKLSYTSDGVVRMLVDTVAEDNFNVETEGQVEIIGWMYQYYNTELKDDTFAKLKKNVKITKERIPAATQLFTPDWIVRYMVENSVGRVWIEHLRAMDSSIDEKAKAEEFGWKYYLTEAEQGDEVIQQLVEIRKCYLNLEPKDITCIDPCMGSGHILVYMFDVLMDIYRSEGFSERDAAVSILENNIRGLDIDRRAYQLSYFALMMKTRGHNRKIFTGIEDAEGNRKKIEPTVMAIEESNSINRNHIQFFGNDLREEERNIAITQLNNLLDIFVDAKEYGSILEVPMFNWSLLYKSIPTTLEEGQISFETLGFEETCEKVCTIVKLGCIMSKRYFVVSTNPPYMGNSGMNTKLLKFVRDNYPDSKSDLFAVFIEKCKKMLIDAGFQSMITQHSWMFLFGYENLRRKIYLTDIVNMVHLGARAFDEIAGEVVQTTTFVVRKTNLKEYKGTYFRLVDFSGEKGKEDAFFKENRFTTSKDLFEKFPTSLLAYWLEEQIGDLFAKEKKLGDISKPRQGLSTSDNDRFLRLWYEVNYFKIGFRCKSRDESKESHKKWFPYNKGGSYRKWYGNQEYILNWENDGEELRAWADWLNKHKTPMGRLVSKEFYFKDSLTWSKVSTSGFSVRFLENGFLFDVSGTSIFLEAKYKKYVLAALNSSLNIPLIKSISPTMNFESGQIANFPIVINDEYIDSIEKIVDECIKIMKFDWDSKEISWEFKNNPLCHIEGTKIEERCNEYIGMLWENKEKLIENEKKIDTIMKRIYGIENDIIINEYADYLFIPHVKSIIVKFISYAVGCMFGRYSLDEQGIVFAGGEWDRTRYEAFSPDFDGVIPINDTEYFEDDIVSRFEEFLKLIFGESTLEQNLEYIANVLSTKGRTFRETIRNYFLNDFYKDHCNLYSATGSGKRPIYWLFDSGKQNGFKCLIYMHRYTKDTLNLIRSEYLHKTEDAVENALKNVEYIIQTSSSAVEKAKATKDRDKYVKQLNEMRIYYQALSHLAIQKIEIDLDNGVKNNYQLFQGIEVIVDGGKKQIVDLLAKI